MMSSKRTTQTRRIRSVIEKAELILRNRGEIEKVLRLKAGGWSSFFEPAIQRLDPRLRISDFEKGKKYYPRLIEDLDVIPGRS